MGRNSILRKPKFWVVVGIVVLVVASLMIINHLNSTRLQRAVRNHHRIHGASYITLGELTNFEWDRAVYFHHVPNSIWVYDAIGGHFGRPGVTDLTIGIVFANGDEIVYYELFPQTWRGLDHRVHFDILTGRILHIFHPDDVLRVLNRNFLAVPVPPPESIEETLISTDKNCSR